MKLSKHQIRKLIREAVALDEPFMRGNDAITVTERKPSRHKGVQNGKPMDLVIWKQIDTKTGSPGMGSMDIPQGMALEEFFEAGEKEGFPDYYRKPETGADMNKSIKAAEERGDWDDSRRNEGKQMKITKRQLRRIIREEKARLLKEVGDQPIPTAPGVGVYRISMVVAVAEDAVDTIQGSIEDGMEFNEDDGEGILEYDIKPETSEYFNKPARRGNY